MTSPLLDGPQSSNTAPVAWRALPAGIWALGFGLLFMNISSELIHSLLPLRYWVVVLLGAVFTLARFSEAFLVLRAQDVGLELGYVPVVMIVMNVFYAAAAYPAEAAADDDNRHTMLPGATTADDVAPAAANQTRPRRLLLLGLALLIAADLVLAFARSPLVVFAGAALWGLHMAFTQGLLSKLVAETAPADLLGTGFGIFNLISGSALLLASVIAGSLWSALGASATFLTGAAFAAVAAIRLVAVRQRKPRPAK
jgi:hypothetical protein